jgi:hypothetical protein
MNLTLIGLAAAVPHRLLCATAEEMLGDGLVGRPLAQDVSNSSDRHLLLGCLRRVAGRRSDHSRECRHSCLLAGILSLIARALRRESRPKRIVSLSLRLEPLFAVTDATCRASQMRRGDLHFHSFGHLRQRRCGIAEAPNHWTNGPLDLSLRR